MINYNELNVGDTFALASRYYDFGTDTMYPAGTQATVDDNNGHYVSFKLPDGGSGSFVYSVMFDSLKAGDRFIMPNKARKEFEVISNVDGWLTAKRLSDGEDISFCYGCGGFSDGN